jgi:DNA-binding transcriptional ArsR family regulator
VTWFRRMGIPPDGFASRRLEERRATRRALATLRDAIHRELERSRRYDRHFVVLRAEVSRGGARQGLAASVREAMRTTDTWCVADRHLYVLLPEAGLLEAERAFERIRCAASDELDPALVQYAEFPGSGLTMGALLSQLRRRHRAPGIIMEPTSPAGASSATPGP